MIRVSKTLFYLNFGKGLVTVESFAHAEDLVFQTVNQGKYAFPLRGLYPMNYGRFLNTDGTSHTDREYY